MIDATEITDCVGCTDKSLDNVEGYYIKNAGKVETAAESEYQKTALEELGDSFISPVQRLENEAGEVYYGVVDYEEGDDWYGFEAYDDRTQGGKRVVGLREVEEAKQEEDFPHVTAGDPSGSFADKPDASYQELESRLREHYNRTGKERPERIPNNSSSDKDSGPPKHAAVER
jgi:hypothetical protein